MDNQKIKVLVVDDDEKIIFAIRLILENEGFDVLSAGDGETGLEIVQREKPEIMILDVHMAGMGGLDVLEKVQEENCDTSVIVVTGFGNMDTAIRAMQLGAFDYLTKPLDKDQLKALCQRAADMRALEKGFVDSNDILGTISDDEQFVGNSQTVQEIFKTIGAVTANANGSSVLILGESGTGKELIAKAIHKNSSLASEPFVAVNCTALPETLLESELFGYEKGAFTDARERKIGRLELAGRGTVFFDEIGDLSLSLQAKLLRVLETRIFQRLGGHENHRIESRFIFATHQNLEQAVKEGCFRSDLFFRINVLPIHLPTLRERKEDIPTLVNYFLQKFAHKMNKSVVGLTPKAMAALERHDFPGNVRELRNMIERAIILCQGSILTEDDLPIASNQNGVLSSWGGLADVAFDYRKARDQCLANFEKQFLHEILTLHKGQVAEAAKQAGIERQSFYRLLKKHGIEPRAYLSD